MEMKFKYFTTFQLIENDINSVRHYLLEMGLNKNINSDFESMKRIISKNINVVCPDDYLHIPIGMN